MLDIFLDDLKEKLGYHLEIFRGKIKLIRNKEREGLIRSRMIGAGHASGMNISRDTSHRVPQSSAFPRRNSPRDPPSVGRPLPSVASESVLLPHVTSFQIGGILLQKPECRPLLPTEFPWVQILSFFGVGDPVGKHLYRAQDSKGGGSGDPTHGEL